MGSERNKRRGRRIPREGLVPLPSELETDFGSFRLGPMWLGAESVQFANPAMEAEEHGPYPLEGQREG